MRAVSSRGWWLIAAACALAGCTITTHVQPLPPATVSSLCIQENEATWSKEFLPTLREQIERHGIRTSVYQGVTPAGCTYRLEYDVNWSWDLAVYLEYADIRVYDGARLIGEATYDARDGSGNLNKFGHTEEKLQPLIDELFCGTAVKIPAGA